LFLAQERFLGFLGLEINITNCTDYLKFNSGNSKLTKRIQIGLIRTPSLKRKWKILFLYLLKIIPKYAAVNLFI